MRVTLTHPASRRRILRLLPWLAEPISKITDLSVHRVKSPFQGCLRCFSLFDGHDIVWLSVRHHPGLVDMWSFSVTWLLHGNRSANHTAVACRQFSKAIFRLRSQGAFRVWDLRIEFEFKICGIHVLSL